MIIEKIPGKLNNKTIINFLERLRAAERLVKRKFTANDLANREAFDRRKREKLGFATKLIERQADFSDMSLGKSTLDYSGCEVISVYNLLLMYDEGSYLDEIVKPLVETFPFVPIIAITTGSAIFM